VTDLGTYSFLPWLRHGIANAVTAADLDRAVRARATVDVELELSGERISGNAPLAAPIRRAVEIYGPGDIVGLDPRAIVRVEPRPSVAAYEPNYLPHVEFYDEDLPWRYTPAAPDGGRLRLRPWIALVVLAQGEFEERAVRDAPLPAIGVLDMSLLPPAGDLWAWAHVHVNRDLAARADEMRSTDMGAVLPKLSAVLVENADLACSRIVCPRRLGPNVGYDAFVVPVFESGRLAGLGLDPSAAPYATASAWEDYRGRELPDTLPVYHRWHFRTGEQQDFESLVRLLQPKPVDPRVGVRALDVQRPGAGLPGIFAFNGILRLGGALRVPRETLNARQQAEAQAFEQWASTEGGPPHPFQVAAAGAVNLADDYEHEPASDANASSGVAADAVDPVITLPLYGRWHALQKRLLRERDGSAISPDDNWVHDLNLDPRHRVAAGYGTRIVQQNQEECMDAAWRQLGDVLEANARIRRAQLAKLAGGALHRRHLGALAAADPGRTLALTAPLHARVLHDGATVRHARTHSFVPPVVTSAPLRRALRPNGPRVRALAARAGTAPQPSALLRRLDAGEIAAAPPKRTPPGVVTVDEVARAVRRTPEAKRRPELVEALSEKVLRPGWAEKLPEPDRFALRAPGEREPKPSEAHDVARRLKAALGDWGVLAWASDEAAREPQRTRLDLGALAGVLVGATDPHVTVPRRTRFGVRFPRRIADQLDEAFQEAMAYPRIDLPMYEPLVRVSSDLFLPNIGLVEQNSITLLETNQPFIEAYMVGLNHEMARELLWREYPSDNRSSVFRQFWDVRAVLADPRLSPDELRESLYDIPKLHLWSRRSDLGRHDNRESGIENEEELVLLIRGELLKRYPTAVVYAHRAAWQLRESDGRPDYARERTLERLTPAEEAAPPPRTVLTPLYEARVEPDITFLGFDLTAARAKGGDPDREPRPDPGWFFIVKERPGDPRFGLDIENPDGEQVETFNDLAWSNAGVAPGGHLPASAFAPVVFDALDLDDDEKRDQRREDEAVNGAAASAARWAYLLYQAPVMVAIHAAEMLRPRP